MSHAVDEYHTPQSPQTRLTQTAADVSPLLADAHSHTSASRQPAQTAVNLNLIPRNHLSSAPSSRSGAGQERSIGEDKSSKGRRLIFNESDKRTARNTQQGKAALTGGTANGSNSGSVVDAAIITTKLGAGPTDLVHHEQDRSPLSESPKSYAPSAASAHPSTTMPRTSSIDSAISSISNGSHVQKQSGEVKDPSRDELVRLIATAGSPENLILHLLRDKNHAAAQGAQLWRLVDKQRQLLLGLNKDLERVTKERDRYRKKAKELQSHPSNGPVGRLRMEDGQSPQSDGEDAVALGESEGASASYLRLKAEQPTPSKGPNGQARSSPVDSAMIPSPLHPQQALRMQSLSTSHLAQPTFALTEASPLSETPAKLFPASRKAPPRPLDLRQTKDDMSSTQHLAASEVAISDGDDEEVRLPSDRGRRKTREEDDHDRELLALHEQETRSRSKKEKKVKAEAAETMDESVRQLPADLPSTMPLTQVQPKLPDHLSPTLTLSAGPSAQLSLPLRSPGLPMSPRPMMNTLMGASASLPKSPRAPVANFPLSPRAPKLPLPMPTTPGQQAPQPAPSSDSFRKFGPSPLAKMNPTVTADSDRAQINESPLGSNEVPPVNRSLVSPTWPDLLLPPNALPSIQVKVASSRLRPSRNSILGLKAPEETAVFSLSIFERATASELWHVEKLPASLPNLEQQLRTKSSDLPRLPDRKLFSGHSPAMVDARRISIETFFEDLLDIPMNELAAVIICQFLSTDVVESQSRLPVEGGQTSQTKTPQPPHGSGIPTKSGYLTKKGKNFGGWKSRYFVLDSPELRYFEAPGGAHLGTIKLLNARIGRQTQSDPGSHAEVDAENQYRHAFLILEPKRKDLNSHVRHVLCAESDAERDEWVETLLHYIDERPTDAKSPYGAGVQALHNKDEDSKSSGSPQFSQVPSDTPSPSHSSNYSPESTQDLGSSTKPLTISGPLNGSVISDAGLWGNKAGTNKAVATPNSGSKDREQKKRNLFQHFRKASNEQLAPVQQGAQQRRAELNAHRGGHIRPVFGMQLQEAVDHYSPADVEVCLPAVVYRCIEFLRVKEASNEEGLFRLSGSNIVIRLLKDRFNTEGDVDLLADEEDYDVHAIASLFKTYLRELPSTILTRELHLEFLKVLELNDKFQKIAAFNALVHQLPAVNFSLLRTLSQYLLEVVQNSDRNKMSVKNVGIVFSPTLNIPAPVFAMFLTDFEAIFDQDSDQGAIRSTEIEREGALTPEDIRSPRRQMFSDLPTPGYNQSSFSQNAAMGNAKAAEYHLDSSGDFGFSPIQPSYETRSYVSVPQEMPRYAPPLASHANNKYGGVNNMLVPDHAASVKAKRRESSMLFM